MDPQTNVVLISAFNRCNWLAAEMKTLGVNVHLVDLTDSLGRWAPEDWEGPLGYFQTDELLQSQKACLDEEDYSEVVDEGFSLWLKSGPFDLRGSHSPYLLERFGISKDIQEYIGGYAQFIEKKRLEMKKKISIMPFHENWFAHFSHSLGAPVFTHSREAIRYGQPLPLFSPYFVRRVSRRGAEKSLQWLKSRQVQVHEKAKLKDISIVRSQVVSVEVEGERSGVIHADQLIWSLSSIETERLKGRFVEELFHGKVLKPEWVWMRYRLDLMSPDLNEALPMKFVVLEDLALPWSHANMLLVQKTASHDSYDVWVRIPEVHRFQKSYIGEIGQQILERFKSRILGLQPRLIDYPQEYHYDEATMGAPRFGQYGVEQRGKIRRRHLVNIHYGGPELCDSLDWSGIFQQQMNIYENIKSWKHELDRKIEKLKSSERD